VIALDAELLLENLQRNSVSPVWCCVMGNEGNRISQMVQKACSTRIRISMASGVDSLSVPVATGILLHGLCERENTEIRGEHYE
jgi:tRNA G18 (ribose-2'-O)-methylase SpoU